MLSAFYRDCWDSRAVLDSARVVTVAGGYLIGCRATVGADGCRGGVSGLSGGCRDHVGCECRTVGPGLSINVPLILAPSQLELLHGW